MHYTLEDIYDTSEIKIHELTHKWVKNIFVNHNCDNYILKIIIFYSYPHKVL